MGQGQSNADGGNGAFAERVPFLEKGGGMISLKTALQKLKEQSKLSITEQAQPNDNFVYFQQTLVPEKPLQLRLISLDLLCKLLAQEVFDLFTPQDNPLINDVVKSVCECSVKPDEIALQLQQIKCLLTLVITYKHCSNQILQCIVKIYLYSPTHQQHSKAALLQICNTNLSGETLKFLCKLSSKVDKQQQQVISELALKARLLGLEILLSVLSAQVPQEGSFLVSDLAIQARSTGVDGDNSTKEHVIRTQVTLTISKNSLLQSNSFDTCLGIFLVLVSNYRTILKAELEILFNEIYLYLLEHPQTTYKNKCSLLDGFTKIVSQPQILLDVWVNYDCEVGMVCVFERLSYIVSMCAKGNDVMVKDHTGVFGILDGTYLNEPTIQNERKFRVKSLRALVAILQSLSTWVDSAPQSESLQLARSKLSYAHQVEASPSPVLNQKILLVSKTPVLDVQMSSGTPQSDSIDSANMLINKTKQLTKDAILKFTDCPNKAIHMLIEGRVLSDELNVAQFLQTTKDLNKKSIGEYIGDGKQFNIHVMYAYIDLFDFAGVEFVQALRTFLQAFRLPGEAQKIDRILEKFSARFCVCNPGIFAKAEVAYTLSFSIMMLNTDQHSSSIKKKMTLQDFIKNNRGINENADLKDSFLAAIYEEIRNNEIVMENERNIINKMTSVVNKKRSKEIQTVEKKSVQLLKQGTNRTVPPYKSASHVDHVRPMFEQVYKGASANFIQIFEECLVGSIPNSALNTDFEVPDNDSNADIAKLCVLGMCHLVKLSCLLQVDNERDQIFTGLARLTNAEHFDQVKYKNYAAVLFMLQLADKYGNLLEFSWQSVLTCVSQLAPLFEGLASGIKDVIGRRPSFKHVYEAYQGQNMTIAIDRIFSNSVRLDGCNILHFYESACSISESEVEQGRTYMLQRIVEISYYNMGRIRLEWTQIWKVLTAYFNKVGCHNDVSVASYAVDSLRQLGVKFLSRVEHSQFNSHNEFLKPFEHIIKHTQHIEIKEQVLQAMQQMISSRAVELKSGWRSIFVIVSRAASDDMSEKAFEMLQSIVSEHPSVLNDYLVDYAGCVVEFALLPSNSEIHQKAIQLLVQSITFLKRSSTGNLKDEDFHLNWFPILAGISRIIYVSQDGVLRNQCVDTLFSLLTEHVEVFDTNHWTAIMKNIILPIFDDLTSDSPSLANSSVWIICLRKLLDFYQQHLQLFMLSSDLLDVPYKLLVALVSCNSDNLASTGIICFQQFVDNTWHQFNDNAWLSCTKCIEHIYQQSIPVELLKFPTHQPKQLTDVEAENEAGIVAAIDVPHAILKCAISLMVLQMTRDLLLPHEEDSVLPSDFMQAIPSKLRYRWISCLHASYTFAHLFNGNYDLRLALKKSGVVQKMPDLIKQETQAISSYLSVLFHVYRLVNDAGNITEQLEQVSLLNGFGQQIQGQFELVTAIMQDCHKVLEQFTSFIQESSKFQRDINNWSPVISLIWKEIAQVPYQQPEYSLFCQHLKQFYIFALKIVVIDGKPEVRQDVMDFLQGISILL